MIRRLALVALLLAPGAATAANRNNISGSVLDRNGKPLERVNVAISPGNVEIITDETGTFYVDYLRDEVGNRVKLQRRTEYTVSFFKVGFHEAKQTFQYKRGAFLIEPITLKEDTIRVDPSADNIDPARFPDRQQTGGGSYEGE